MHHFFKQKSLILFSQGESLTEDIQQESRELIDHLILLCQGFKKTFISNQKVTLEEIGDLFRTLHTLKGLSQMANLLETVSMTHAVEDYIELIRSQKVELTEEIVELLFDVQHTLDEIYRKFPQTADIVILAEQEKLSLEFTLKANAFYEKLEENSQEGKTALPSLDTPAPDQDEHPSSITEEENQLFSKFISRPEHIFALLLKNGEYLSVDDLKHGSQIDNISRVGDLILLRVFKDESLIVFAAELEASTLSSLIESDVILLEKKQSPFDAFSLPWNELSFKFNTPAPANEIAIEVKNEEQLIAPTPSQSAEQTSTQTGDDGEPEEDFDTKNLSGANAVAIPDLDPEMLQDFLSSADELIESLGQSMLELESNPDSKECVESIFRSAHTIKGTSGMFGFRAIEKLTHKMENFFDRIRKGTLSVTPALMDGLFFAIDRIKTMFDSIKENKPSELPINDALEKLKMGALGKKVETTAKNEASSKQNETKQQETKSPTTSEAKPISGNDAKGKTPDAAGDKKKNDEAGGTIRVDLKRLDSLVNLVGELVIDRTRFARIEEELRGTGNSALGHAMSESVLLFSRHMNEVQSIIMKIRMVPVGNAFYKFTRVVRDLCRQIGKEIDLHILGGETELDKTLVEEIADPLVHLIRNSVDHGIELPDDREKIGKSRKGNINLKANQDGNMIVITIQDDGKGLQVDRIRNKAIERGLIKETDQLSNKEIFNLIFEAGFSTAEKVTNISGRGVGMDVVKKSIVKLKGIIELDSEIGKGTTTTIKLPLTLAIIPSLMVETRGESYAIPLVNVIESIRIRPNDIQKMGSADFVKLRDRVLPLLKLSDVFDLHMMEELLWYKTSDIQRNMNEKETSSTENSFRARHAKPRLIFVVVGVGEKRVGVVVEQLQGQQEIVIKSLGKLIGKQRGVAGGCVLGNGRVALVLDVGEIIDEFSQTKIGGRNVVLPN